MTEIISRKRWGAVAGVGWSTHDMPVSESWLHHSADTFTLSATASIDRECQHMRFLERVGVDRFGYADKNLDYQGAGISYTNVIFPSGRIYEGHDPTRNASHTQGHNAISTSICFAGDYTTRKPTKAQIKSAAWLLRHRKNQGINTKAELTGGHRDTASATSCPGDAAYRTIRQINKLAATSKGDNMATTLNGRPVLTKRSQLVWIPGPHSATQLEGYANQDAADLLMGLRYLQHAHIRPITQLDAWRSPDFNDGLDNSATNSNHPGGWADDGNWTDNPFKRVRDVALRQPHSFTKAEQRLRRDHRWICRDKQGRCVIRFGSDFGDDMHDEVAFIDSESNSRYVPDQSVFEAAEEMRKHVIVFRTHEQVKTVQRRLGVTADGHYGTGSMAACRRFQKALGVSATGLWDPTTETAYTQHLLNEVTDAGLTVDGKPGRNTTAATLHYQTEYRPDLDRDGKPGPNTTKALEADMTAITQLIEKVDALQRRADDNGLQIKALPASVTSAILRYTNPNVSGGEVQVYTILRSIAEVTGANLVATEDVGEEVGELSKAVTDRFQTGATDAGDEAV